MVNLQDMYLEIDGQGYELISSSEAGISLDFKNPELPIIYAHPLQSIDQVKSFVRAFKKPNPFVHTSSVSHLEFLQLNIFDSKVAVKIARAPKFSCFWKGDMATCSLPNRMDMGNDVIQKKIADYLFEQFIQHRVSYWEEELNVLIGEIHFRKMQRQHFSLKKENSDLTFNKNNKQFPKRINDYIVCKAILSLFNDRTKTIKLLQAYFAEEQQIERIIDHG
ncbi:hypothetical protein ACP6L2_07505 [Sphingobacterium lactis]|uniref:hypothetical protein n=1 Tax=Sphingobacterium lactis TaxID=797291 RepID=UPI003F7D1D22